MRKALIVFILGSMLSCQTKKRPEQVLTKEQLSALLVDIYLAEARTEAIPKVRDSTIRYFIPFEQKLFKAKGVSDSVMHITYAYYMEHTKELEQVYDAVIDTLTLREQQTSKNPHPKPLKSNPPQ